MTQECTRCEGMPALERPDEPVCKRCDGSGEEPAPCGYGEASCQDTQLRDPAYTCHDHAVPVRCEKCGGNGWLDENGQKIVRTTAGGWYQWLLARSASDHAPMKACNRCFGTGIEPPEDIGRAPTPAELIADAHPDVVAHAERVCREEMDRTRRELDPPPPPPPPPIRPFSPMVHSNGTGRRELENQLSNAGAAVRAAMGFLRDAYPNGRDYYIQDTFKAACAEWDARLERLQLTYKEIFQIYENVADQE